MNIDKFESESAGFMFRFRQTDTGKTLEITCLIIDIADDSPVFDDRRRIIDGAACEDDPELFAQVWHRRIRAIVSG